MPARGHSVGDPLDASLCLLTSEVHEHVPAEDCSRLGYHRAGVIAGEVVMCNPYVASKRCHDLVAALDWRQITSPAFERQPLDLTLSEMGLFGSSEGVERDVGGDDVPVVPACLVEEDREAVRLLPVAASGGPHSVRFSACGPRQLGERDELR